MSGGSNLEVIDVGGELVISVVRVLGRSGKFGTEIKADLAWLITVGANQKAIRVETFTDKAHPRGQRGAGVERRRRTFVWAVSQRVCVE